MRKITLLCTLLFTLSTAFAQTTLGAGDIAFVGLNTDGATDADDNFAFILLKDIDAATQIIFTDRGWSDATGFSSYAGDGEFTWISGAARTAGEVIVLDFSNLSPPAASFTVAGDQLFAIQGSIASPVFIAGLHFNVVTGVTDDANWDGDATSNTTSALPDALTTGDTAVRLTGPGGVEQDNFQFSCGIAGCPLSGTPEQIRAIVHNLANWISNDDTVYPGTVDVNFGTPTVGSLGSITVLKNVDDDTYADMMFDFTFDGTPFAISENNGGYMVNNLPAGTYTILESVPSDWDLTSISAGGQNNNTGAVDGVNVVLEEGENAIITFNNVYTPADNTPPVVTSCPEPIEMDSERSTELGNECGDFVTWTPPMASDNLPGVILTSNYEPGDLFPFGATEVVYTATDAAGNQAECKFMVTVNDIKAPTPICINGLTVELDATTGLGTIFATDFIGSPSDDSCGPVTYLISRVGSDVKSPSLTLSCEDEEITLVRIWAEDVNGNSDYCETYIQVDKSKYMCPVPPIIDLELEMSVDNATPNVGDPVTFTVVVINQGPSAATGVEVTDLLTSGYAYAGFTTTQGSYNNVTGLWTLGSLAANANATLTLTATVNATGNYMNLAEVTAQNENDIDSTPNNGVDTDGDGNFIDDPEDEDDGDGAIAVVQSSDLELEMSVDIATPNVGDLVTFTVVVTNQGPSAATGVEVTDQLPSGYTYAGFTTTQGSYNNETGLWTLGSLAANGNATLTLSGNVSASGDYLNLAEVTALNEFDIDSTPNNGVDTDGDGNFIDDPDDEDDGDGAKVDVIIPCEVVIVTPPKFSQTCLAYGQVTSLSVTVEPKDGTTFSYRWEQSLNGGDPYDAPGQTSTSNTLEISFDGSRYVGYASYRVRVFSDNGTPNDTTDDCLLYSDWVTVTVDSAPEVEITGKDSYCHDGNGVTLDAGAGFASYLWSPGGQTTQTITALEGSYSVTVSNELGCEATSEAFIVTNNEPLTCSIDQDVLTTDHETEDGVATVNPLGGTGEYTYLWDNGETGQTATKLTYGMHWVTVTDSNGCETSCQVDIAKKLYCWTNLIQNVSVKGGSDGAARAMGNGGYAPFTFKWDDGSTEATNSKLTAGTHFVTITDAMGDTSRCSVTVSEPNETNCSQLICSIEQDVLTMDHETEDGVATVYVKGGTGQYTYLWDNGETTQQATTLTYGMHSVTVTDANGCETTCQIDIAKELYCWINLYSHVSVRGGNDGSAKVHGNGGYRPFTYQWDDGTTNQLNTNLKAGIHYVTITDATGATSRCRITITEPNEEICDGMDNDGDGEIDEGFDADGDGIADCYDKCPNGDDTLDQDGDGIPDACDDEVCIKPEIPQTACYETAIWNPDNCRWDIIGKQPEKPKTDCFETATWNPNTCSWDIIGKKPEMPPLSCYETANWNPNSCTWDITRERPEMPKTECDETAVWDFNSCSWVIVNERPKMPETACYETAIWNADTCSWDIEGEQPEMPQTACYETATWNPDTCSWDVEGEQPLEPQTECYETATWNPNTCTWDVEGSQPEEPQIECYETATWNPDTCSWDIEGEQPEMPETLCYETAIWNPDTCEWDISQDDDKSCAGGSIDECQTAYARSSDENIRTCFLDIPNINANRWGWTNEFPSIDGVYEMDLYAAAGQCDISKGALVGSVQVVYSGGSVSVTVSTLGGYKMTEAQLYVGSNAIPTKANNGNLTVAPGDYPYEDNINGDFVTHTFQNLSAGDMDSFYVILHAEVCPVDDVSKYQAPTLELSGYPVPFKEDFTLVVISPREMKSELSLYDGIGKRVQTFGNYYLKKGRNEIGLKTNELPAGMYYVYVTTGSGNQILKVLRKP